MVDSEDKKPARQNLGQKRQRQNRENRILQFKSNTLQRFVELPGYDNVKMN